MLKKMVKSKLKEKIIAGVDIGGTKISVFLGNLYGDILKTTTFPTNWEKTPDEIIDEIVSIINIFSKETEFTPENFKGIGIACPGPINYDAGIMISPPNLPRAWSHFKLIRAFEKRTKIKTYIENDANCGAIGEKEFGNGRNFKDFLYITVSTGIGGGLILNNKIYVGASFNAGEIGHMIIKPHGNKCNCGKSGCLEAYSSGTALAEALKRDKNLSASLKEEIKKRGFKTEAIIEAIKARDLIAQKIWNDACDKLALVIANILQVLNLEAVIIGGGVSKAGDLLFKRLNVSIQEYLWPKIYDACKILPSKFPDTIVSKGIIALVKNA
jgi:glucokinase